MAAPNHSPNLKLSSPQNENQASAPPRAQTQLAHTQAMPTSYHRVHTTTRHNRHPSTMPADLPTDPAQALDHQRATYHIVPPGARLRRRRRRTGKGSRSSRSATGSASSNRGTCHHLIPATATVTTTHTPCLRHCLMGLLRRQRRVCRHLIPPGASLGRRPWGPRS